MSDVRIEDFRVVQLREWLRQLDLQTTGNKSELVLRLNAVPVDIRGNCPEMQDPVEIQELPDNVSDDSSGSQDDDVVPEIDVLTKELMLMRKEKELLKMENELLKATTAVEKKVEYNFNTLKEFIPDFDGQGNVELWIAQFGNLGKTYALKNECLKALLMCKLKGDALSWLHSKADYVMADVQRLTDELRDAFNVQGNKLLARRKFELRKWVYGESFMKYYNEKMMLAGGLQMENPELIDHIIDGITDVQLRTQATIQCFDKPENLLRAFLKVELSKPVLYKPPRAADVSGVRCYNCNAVGHYAANCRKPKREMGSCFACGSLEHKAMSCPQRKGVHLVEDVNHVSNFKIFFDKDTSFLFLCLIDSGSPISLVRKKFVPSHITILNCYDFPYFGINKSELKIVGIVSCFIWANKKISFQLVVVEDESMGYDCVLGRDVMKMFGIKLTKDCDEKETNERKSKENIENKMMRQYNDNFDEHLMKNFEKQETNDRKSEVNIEYETVNENQCYDKENNNEECHTKDKNFHIENIVNCDVLSPEPENIGILHTTTNEKTRDSFIAQELNYYAPQCKGKDVIHDDFCSIIEIDNDFNHKSLKYIVGNDVPFEVKSRLEKILENDYLNVERSKEPKTKCYMKLNLKSEKPFQCSPRRLSYTEKKELQKLLDEWTSKGFIRPSDSEFVSPIVLVRKKTGELRLCVDYRTLNKNTEKDNFPIPLIDDLLDRLANKKYFTKLDLKDGFFHVFMHPESIKFTSFITPLGQYEFLTMPFGLKNSPAKFQRFVNKVFDDMIRDGRIIIYLDDIMIATENLEEHFKIISVVLKRLSENNLELRFDKCEFLQSEVRYLGYTITRDGIMADESGILTVKNFPVPKSVHQVQSFLGLCSYFRRFVQNFSVIAKPLYDLTRKDKKFKFGTNELEAFENLKQRLAESPILAIYDPNDPIELHCDASALGYGAILLQKKKDGRWHPIFYFSKRTTTSEAKYHSFELETLAIVYALRRFRVYLQGLHFKIITDCNSLTMTLNKKDLNPRIARWALELENYDYKVEHRSGTSMQHVDALSRIDDILIIQPNTFEENLIICQNRDENIQMIKELLEKGEHKWYEMRNGVVYRKNKDGGVLFFVPESMENHVLYKYHDELGHVGIDKVTEIINKSYWFPKVRNKVSKHIQNCLKCITFSDKPGKVEGFLHNIPKTSIPFEVLHIDHIGPLENSKNLKKHILVVVDSGTKFVRLYPNRTTKSKEAILALNDYFRAYSRPRCIVSDRGSAFTSAEFEDFLKSHNIQHIKIATGSPQANGQVERINRSLAPMIAKLTDYEKNNGWDKTLESVEYTLNNTVHRTIKEHPSVMLFGVRQKGKMIDSLKENVVDHQNKRKKEVKEIRFQAELNEKRLQDYNTEYVNKKRREPIQYKEGDYIMIKNFDSHVGACRKLIPKFKGPYKISKVLRNDRYVVEDVEGFQHTQLPYKGVWSVENIRPWIQEKLS